MKLYMHPASTTCRPIMMFITDQGMTVDQEVVDIMAGKQYEESFTAVNPNNQVPVLDDDGFLLTESSAILKYLAEKIDSSAYPRELKVRARVNQAMDWCNTNFYRNFGYGLCYSQLLEPYKLPDSHCQQQLIEASKKQAERFLGILDQHVIGPRPYLCGEAITIADYLASGMVSLGDVIGCHFTGYPNVQRWYATMRDRPNWESANAGLAAWADFARGPSYVSV